MLGVIADDLTGATDVADVLVDGGFRTVIVPDPAAVSSQTGPVDAIVVALKSRTVAPECAVAMSSAAYDQLAAIGCQRFYFKYCSTFDSTGQGNIGPVIDMLLERTGASATVVVPAYPKAARTVYQGHLFVHDLLLSESSMRDHPLTPMLDSDLCRLLRPQTQASVAWVPLSDVRAGPEHLRSVLSGLATVDKATTARKAIVVDAIDDKDLWAISAATAGWPLLTGSAGLAAALSGPSTAGVRAVTTHPGRRAILCGSASDATRAQVRFARSRIPAARIDLARLAADEQQELDRLAGWALAQYSGAGSTLPVLVYATGPDDLVDPAKSEVMAAGIEQCLARLAGELVRRGVTQLIIAGGETSGAVVEQLGVESLTIGWSIAPGVPWTSARLRSREQVNLALKSGNFGPEDLFLNAWRKLEPNDAGRDVPRCGGSTC